LEISVAPATTHPGVTVVALSGEIDGTGAQELGARLVREFELGHNRIVLDMSGVSYLNSAGIGELAMAAKRARSLQGDLALCGLQDRVRRVLELVRMDQLLVVASGLEPACAALADHPVERDCGSSSA